MASVHQGSPNEPSGCPERAPNVDLLGKSGPKSRNKSTLAKEGCRDGRIHRPAQLSAPIRQVQRREGARPVTSDRVASLHREIDDFTNFCRSLDSEQWYAESAAAEWRIKDVVAHIGASCHALFAVSSLKMLKSSDIERTNDVFVDARRDWSHERVVDEYLKWTPRLIMLANVVTKCRIGGAKLPLAELGWFRLDALLIGAMVFDHHVHLRHDMAPAVGLPAPETDAQRLAIVLEWMFAVLHNQMTSGQAALDHRCLILRLEGAGGGSWRVDPAGVSATMLTGSAADATIIGMASEFPVWGTRRVHWAECQVDIAGDQDIAVRFLDWLNVV